MRRNPLGYKFFRLTFEYFFPVCAFRVVVHLPHEGTTMFARFCATTVPPTQNQELCYIARRRRRVVVVGSWYEVVLFTRSECLAFIAP